MEIQLPSRGRDQPDPRPQSCSLRCRKRHANVRCSARAPATGWREALTSHPDSAVSGLPHRGAHKRAPNVVPSTARRRAQRRLWTNPTRLGEHRSTDRRRALSRAPAIAISCAPPLPPNTPDWPRVAVGSFDPSDPSESRSTRAGWELRMRRRNPKSYRAAGPPRGRHARSGLQPAPVPAGRGIAYRRPRQALPV
jgi:hypothetical protein